ncbi:MAG: hypothetical protein QOJ04_6054 [Caballeronia sp.]|nr:hypothetical protein [Caballeronia sp.]
MRTVPRDTADFRNGGPLWTLTKGAQSSVTRALGGDLLFSPYELFLFVRRDPFVSRNRPAPAAAIANLVQLAFTRSESVIGALTRSDDPVCASLFDGVETPCCCSFGKTALCIVMLGTSTDLLTAAAGAPVADDLGTCVSFSGRSFRPRASILEAAASAPSNSTAAAKYSHISKTASEPAAPNALAVPACVR